MTSLMVQEICSADIAHSMNETQAREPGRFRPSFRPGPCLPPQEEDRAGEKINGSVLTCSLVSWCDSRMALCSPSHYWDDGIRLLS